MGTVVSTETTKVSLPAEIAATVRALVLEPGRLTIDFLEGRRARYLSPVRLYLTCSVLYFLLAAGIHAGHANPKSPVSAITEEQRNDMIAEAALAPKILQPVMLRLVNDQAGLQNDVVESIPQAMFLLLPAFVLIMKLFYQRRRLSEHAYFSLHVHAQLFFALSLTALAGLTHIATVSIVVGVAVLLWTPIYWHIALRRVYGGSNGMTMLKELGISALYGIVTAPMLTILAIWASSGR